MDESWKLRRQDVSFRCSTEASVCLLVTMWRVLCQRFGSFASFNRHGVDERVLGAWAVQPALYAKQERQ